MILLFLTSKTEIWKDLLEEPVTDGLIGSWDGSNGFNNAVSSFHSQGSTSSKVEVASCITGTTGTTGTTDISGTTGTTLIAAITSENHKSSQAAAITAGVLVPLCVLFLIAAAFVYYRYRRLSGLNKSNNVPLQPSQHIANIEVLEKIGGGNFGAVYRGLMDVCYCLSITDFYRTPLQLPSKHYFIQITI
jgi:hypothetical protein